MLIKRKRGWEMPERDATPEALFLDRRSLLKGAAAGGILASAGLLGMGRAEAAGEPDPSISLYPAKANATYTLDRPVTAEKLATGYNNFYEFGTDKDIVDRSQALKIRPWTIKIDGLVEKEQTLAIDDLFKQVQFEERLYRHRCVEAWSMVIPWVGYSLSELIKQCDPLPSAKYVQFLSYYDKRVEKWASDSAIYWPYTEGLRMDEAMHPLTLLTFGLYGEVLPNQNGAPIRVVLPWKYGFKSAKSIVTIRFVDKEPPTTWNEQAPSEYGFYSNVNPDVDHPRWSQKTERRIGLPFYAQRKTTLMFNGYGEQVASLYNGMNLKKYF